MHNIIYCFRLYEYKTKKTVKVFKVYLTRRISVQIQKIVLANDHKGLDKFCYMFDRYFQDCFIVTINFFFLVFFNSSPSFRNVVISFV